MGYSLTKWILDAYIFGDRVYLDIYDDSTNSIEKQIVDLYFYGYIKTSNPEHLVDELRKADGVEDAWIESWLIPPFYDLIEPVVVFTTKSYQLLKYILWLAKLKNLRVVNTFPHPLIEALYRTGIQPLTPINHSIKGRIETSEWNPRSRDPELKYIVVEFSSGYYVVETPEETIGFWELGDLVEYIKSDKFHLGFTDPYIYMRLVEEDLGIKTSVYKWIYSGGFSPHEYFEWCRLAYTPLSLMNNTSIGKMLSTIEALYARDRRMLIDKSRSRRESWRSISELLVYDRGGVVYQPKPGLYWSVCQADFKSLYPSIMVKYNVSGETVDKPGCRNTLILPWTPHRICLDSEGVVPGSIKRLIELKDLYDTLYRETMDELYKERKNAVKWILVASIGYLGYRNSFFGSVMAHEVVTSTSREVLKKARIAVEKKGYRIIHAIIDSLFIEGTKTLDECIYLKNTIEEATGFQVKIEAHYTWLYIPRSLNSDESTANKYYGLTSSGEPKIKGILAVRRDTPLIVRKAELEALSKLFEAQTPWELSIKLEEAHSIIDKYIELLRKREVEIRELVVSRNGRTREEYVKPPLYIFNSKPPYRLVYIDGRLVPLEKTLNRNYDVDKYIELLEKAKRELPTRRDLEDLFYAT